RRPAYQLHRNPKQSIRLRPKGINVGCIRVIKAGCETGLAHESPNEAVAELVTRIQDLDHCFSSEQRLLSPKHDSKAPLAQLLANQKFAERTPDQGASGLICIHEVRFGIGFSTDLSSQLEAQLWPKSFLKTTCRPAGDARFLTAFSRRFTHL